MQAIVLKPDLWWGRRGLPSSSAAARQREWNQALEQRVDELEGKRRRGLEEIRAALKGGVKALREEHAQRIRQWERKLA